MVTWSRLDLENWADAILEDYLKERYESFAPIDLMQLATEYLGLTVCYDTLSDNLEIYGISVFDSTTLTLERGGETVEITVRPDTILMEAALLQEHLQGVHHFTLGHEIAHQILTRWEQRARMGEQVPALAYHKPAQPRNWREWQADTLGSCLLMPRRLIDECLFRFGIDGQLTIYDRYYLAEKDKIKISSMARFLGVSKAALLNRLVTLGHAVRKPFNELFERMWW